MRCSVKMLIEALETRVVLLRVVSVTERTRFTPAVNGGDSLAVKGRVGGCFSRLGLELRLALESDSDLGLGPERGFDPVDTGSSSDSRSLRLRGVSWEQIRLSPA